MRLRQSTDLILVIVFAGLAFAGATAVPADLPLRTVLAGPLVLLLPGYALSHAMQPRLNSGAERLLLSLTLSVAACVLGGLVLNLTPIGLNVASWATLLAAVTIGAALIAVIRRQPVMTEPARPPLSIAPGHYVMFGCSLALVVGALSIAQLPVAEQPAQGYTQLWAVPTNATTGGATVQVGVRSMEAADTAYRLRVVADQAVQEYQLQLHPDDAWQIDVDVSSVGSSTPGTLEADLYRVDAPQTVYRRVFVRLDA